MKQHLRKRALGWGLLAACCVPVFAVRADQSAVEEPLIVDTQWDAAFGFPVGEELVYSLHWGIFNVGTARMTTRWVDEDGRRLLHIRGITRSNKVISKLYPVNDMVEAYVEPKTFLPVRFMRNLSEGRTRRHDETVFDFGTMRATYRSLIKDKVREYSINHDSRDLLSFMYFTRRHGFETNSASQFKVMADDKLYDLTTQSHKIETVHLDRYGDVEALKMEPKAAFEGLFVRKGRMFTWVSTDPRQLLVKAWVDTPFANVRINLEEVRGPGSDFWVDPKR